MFNAGAGATSTTSTTGATSTTSTPGTTSTTSTSTMPHQALAVDTRGAPGPPWLIFYAFSLSPSLLAWSSSYLLSGRSKWLESFSEAVVGDEPSIHPLAKQSAYSYFILIFLFLFLKLLHQMNNPSIRQPSGLPFHCIAWLILLELSKHGMTFCPPHRIKVALYFVNMANCQYVPCWTVWQDIWSEHKVL